MIKVIIIFVLLVIIYYISYFSYKYCFCKKEEYFVYSNMNSKKVGFDDNITVILFNKEDTIDETKNKNMIYKICT